MYKHCFLISLVLMVTACGIAPTSIDGPTIVPTVSTATSTPTLIPKPTFTDRPTVIPSPTPPNLQVISRQNVLQIKELAGWKLDDYLLDVKWSSDGQTLAVGGLNIYLYDTSTLKELRVIRPNDWVGHIAFSPNNHMVAAGNEYFSSYILRVWDANSGRMQITLRGHTDWVSDVAFSPDQQFLVSGGGDKVIHIWDIQSGQVQRTFVGHDGTVWCLTFSPDGKILASGSGDGTVRLWDFSSGQLLHVFRNPGLNVFSVAFSPDGKLLAAGDGNASVWVWDLQSHDLLHKLVEYATTQVDSLVFSPDGSIIVSGRDSAQIWDTNSGELLHTLNGASGSFAFSPDGKMLASAFQDGSVKLWGISK